MSLYKAILKAQEKFGIRIVVEERLINIVADFGGYTQYPATRHILKSVIDSGMIRKILAADLRTPDSARVAAFQMAMEFSRKYGYNRDLARYVIESVAYTLLDRSLRPKGIVPPVEDPVRAQYPMTVPIHGKVKGFSSSFDKDQEYETDHIALSGTINGYKWVDLGLPSGLLWATCNVGASNPEEYGNYFAWGEIQPKSSYDEDNSETYKKTDNSWLFYQGYINDNGNLTLEHDAARQNWGGSWRMPTTEEINELIDNTTTEWVTHNGVEGRLFKSNSNGNSIFFPAGGWISETYHCNIGRRGGYWSAYASSLSSEYASLLNFGANLYDFRIDDDLRSAGWLVRPVSSPRVERNFEGHLQSESAFISCDKPIDTRESSFVNKLNDHEWVDLGLPSGLKWATCNVGANRPEEIGDYFSWGEKWPKAAYAEYNTETYGMNIDRLLEKGYIDTHLHLTSKYDAARQEWGDPWRMPTAEEIQELKDNTNTEWITRKWINGMLFRSRINGNSIFLPAGGLWDNSSLNDFGAVGNYWSATPGSGKFYPSYALNFSSFGFSQYWLRRYYGFNVRPVLE